MSFQLSHEQFRTMIFYDWKIGLTYKDLPYPFSASMEGATHRLITQSLIGFVNFNAINLVFTMLLVQVVLQHLLLNKQLILYEK